MVRRSGVRAEQTRIDVDLASEVSVAEVARRAKDVRAVGGELVNAA